MRKLYLIPLILLLIAASSARAQNYKLCIADRPKPELPADYGNLDAQGSITLRVTFLDNGEIGDVVLVSGLIKRLDDLAIAAARKIKFRPENRNGKAISSTKPIQYSYSPHGFWGAPKRKVDCGKA